MNIAVFNRTENHTAQIVDALLSHARRWPAARPDETLRPILARFLDEYIDVLVTGQADTLAAVFWELFAIAALEDLLDLPLEAAAAIRRTMSDKPNAVDTIEQLERDLDEIDRATIECVRRMIELATAPR
jgi:hypothetical protein